MAGRRTEIMPELIRLDVMHLEAPGPPTSAFQAMLMLLVCVCDDDPGGG